MSKKIDMTNLCFGRLTVLKENPVRDNKIVCWDCICECGNKTTVRGSHLRQGLIKSCGCLLIDSATSHGKSRSKAYDIWHGMIQRCTNSNNPDYEKYKFRPICDRWLKFENFYEDMGDPPSDKHTIERVNNDLGYNPDNCKWATRSEQSHNTGMYSNNTSGHKGVYWFKRSKKWRAQICVDNKLKFIGYFDSLKDAVAARKDAEMMYWGNDANGEIAC